VTAVSLNIPPRSAYVGVVRLAVAALARSASLDEETVGDLRIAISEACANAVISNESAGGNEPVMIYWTEHPDRIIVEIGDRGEIYEGGSSHDSWDTGRITPRITMSVALLSSLVDECEFVPRAGGGTLARLVILRRN
jgi:serine/threonine-protein kinase RsbW